MARDKGGKKKGKRARLEALVRGTIREDANRDVPAPIGSAQQQAPPPQAPAGAPCPKCNTPNPPGTKFCGNCGNNLLGQSCPSCKTPNPPGTKFCGNCGTKMG